MESPMAQNPPMRRTGRGLVLQRLSWALVIWLLAPSPARGEQETLMQVLVVFGAPGHSSVHLQRGERQLYWDPGGAYGTEYDDCLEYNSEGYCQRFAGFPWKALKAGRHNDVFFGELADLTRVIAIYHLDGDRQSQVYSFHLRGALGRRAWNLLERGGREGADAPFHTDRNPMFCVKGVTEYLNTLGGPFAGLPNPWYPSDLATALQAMGAQPSRVYTLEDRELQRYIARTRQRAGLGPLALRAEAGGDPQIPGLE